MKKSIVLFLAGAFIVGMSSCKKDYECCSVTTGDGFSAEACITQELTKKEATDFEEAGTLTESDGSTTVTTCKEL